VPLSYQNRTGTRADFSPDKRCFLASVTKLHRANTVEVLQGGHGGDKCARSEGPQRVVDVLVDVLDAGGLRSRACVQQREIKPSDGEHAEQAWSGCGVLTGIISLKYSEPDDRQMCDDLPLQRIAAPL
jgi:hypothetical protein